MAMLEREHTEHKATFFRRATALDIPSVWCLLDDYKHLFLEDDEEIDRDQLQELCVNGDLVVLDDNNGLPPWGCFWVSDINNVARHGILHFLCRPNRLKTVIKNNLVAEFIDRAFIYYNLDKLKARAIENQTVAIQLLVGHCFFKIGKHINEVRFHGKPANVVLFELGRRYWHKKGRHNAASFTGNFGRSASKRRCKNADGIPSPRQIRDRQSINSTTGQHPFGDDVGHEREKQPEERSERSLSDG